MYLLRSYKSYPRLSSAINTSTPNFNDIPNILKHRKALNDNITNMINSLVDLKYAINTNDMNGLYSTRFDIDITARVISRTTGCLARAIDSAFKPKKEYPQPVAKSSAVDAAVNPANQELVDALIYKAESYPDNKVYQRNAYITVAEMVVKNTKVISLRTYRWRPDLYNIEGIEFSTGKSTEQFIINYLKDKPERVCIVERF